MLSGIVITGGAARIPDLQKAFSRQTGGDLNIRIVKGLPENITLSFGVQVGDPDRLYTLYSLLLAGKDNCVGEVTEDPVQKTFDFEKKEEPEEVETEPTETQEPEEPQDKPKKPSTLGRLWKTFEKMLSDEVETDDEKA